MTHARRIEILEPAIIDRIAAGEVVERPASVAKELVENSLDAGAARVDVQVEAGGVRLIEVVDDGRGMDATDAELAFAQHATSKIAQVDDLDVIGTFGFRGEALASIASVSRVEMNSGGGEGPGVRVRVEGGEIESLQAVAWPRGTTLRVADLFFNTPARRKHLKKQTTEFGHVAHTVADYALARPDVHFTLRHGKREVLAAPPVTTLRERVQQVLGGDVADHWLPVEYGAGIRVSGGVTSPEHVRPNRRQIRWFVNGRPVADYRLTHALVSAFDTLLNGGKYPVAALFIELPLNQVDVNIHPRKAEVRFIDPRGVYRAVRTGVRESIASRLPPTRIRARVAAGPRPGRDSFGLIAEPGADAAASRHASLPLRDWIVAEGTSPAGATVPVGDVGSRAAGPVVAESLVTKQRAAEIIGTRGTILPLAQYANTYIIAADDDGILIIDQHVAHERILYEQLLEAIEARQVEAQHLLVPETVELSADEAARVEENAELLDRLGFAVEPFGGDSWTVRTAPAVLEGRGLEHTLRSLLDSLGAGRGAEALEEAQRQAAATIACHAAVRANHPLSREEMVRLVSDLALCAAPTRCPHGRPILLRLDHDEIEKRIGRR